MTEPTTPHLGQQYGFSGYDSKPEKTLEGTPCTISSESASAKVGKVILSSLIERSF
ncbi:hypothetical protein MMJ46_11940 [Enterococcus cecorum]|nr:hypothetical protein [Enterococcus cecorum]MCJ0597954.1 hypothetical protein [Enterococcus cecorum]